MCDSTFFQEEVRSDYLVSAQMKKVWAVEMEMIVFLDSICKKHGLKYYMDYGTLLGAVRHKGFIPWDDDVDLAMFRDDYEKLKEIAKTEIREPYFFQTPHTDQIMFGFAKIRDNRTSAIEFPDLDSSINQGIFIDIFPLDDVPGKPEESTIAFRMQEELLEIISNPEGMLEKLKNGVQTTLPYDMLISLLKETPQQVFAKLEEFSAGQCGTSAYVDNLVSQVRFRVPARERKWYENTIYLPFENLLLPAPENYDAVLKKEFGDYMKIPEDKSRHNIIYDTECPYQVTMKKMKRV